MKKTKNKVPAISLILATILLLILLGASPGSQTIPTSFTAGENPGFDLTLGHLNFGKIIPGSSATRSLTITNTNTYPTVTKIKSSGQISPYLIVSENNFLLQPNQSKNITFTAYPTKDLELKEYPGQIIITTHKA